MQRHSKAFSPLSDPKKRNKTTLCKNQKSEVGEDAGRAVAGFSSNSVIDPGVPLRRLRHARIPMHFAHLA